MLFSLSKITSFKVHSSFHLALFSIFITSIFGKFESLLSFIHITQTCLTSQYL